MIRHRHLSRTGYVIACDDVSGNVQGGPKKYYAITNL